MDYANNKYLMQQGWDVANGDFLRLGTGGGSVDNKYIMITSSRGIQLIGVIFFIYWGILISSGAGTHLLWFWLFQGKNLITTMNFL